MSMDTSELKIVPPLSETRRNDLPDVQDFINADPRPTFVVPIHLSEQVKFEIAFANKAFRNDGFLKHTNEDATLGREFRAWCQTVIHWRKEYDFAGTTWAAFRIKDQWKCIRALRTANQNDNYSPIQSTYPEPSDELQKDRLRALEDLSIADQRLASLYRMMEMSDVGTFEYNLEGTLLRANESWYRLSLHPRTEKLHRDFSFMDLVYPPDAPLVLSQWNKLAQGNPITFEMRWKGKNYQAATDETPGIDDYQWVLSACVPVSDEEGNIITIAGNTIDINAQKRVQDEAIRRAEALERARESELRFSRFASLSPIAIYILESQGVMTFCNGRFFELAGYPVGEDYHKIDWRSVFYREDHPAVNEQWTQLLRDKQWTQAHFRLQHTWNLGDGTERQAWCEHQTFPELDRDGNIISIFGTLTDISRFKWAEEIQRTRVEEALLAKRKHENFIDMTSHEMRNPLSAVIQCADSTIDSLKAVSVIAVNSTGPEADSARRITREIKMSLDSLNTIITCSLHQKRVIDDILTLSKMDSNLLTIAPVRVETSTIVSEAVHMFQVESKKDKIDLRFVQHPSLEEVGATYVMMDPSRVVQVLINLLTNAIKFTRDRPIREIEVTLGACTQRPSTLFCHEDIPYASVIDGAEGLIEAEEWGNGPEVFIWIQVRDTGCGLSPKERSSLFTRFTQATPRTHIRYGGSGLGLFISKKLTELQGGAIGVKSESDVGSIFSFFVAARVAAPPSPTMLARVNSVTPTPTSPIRPIEPDEPVTPSLSRNQTMQLAHPTEQPKYHVLIVEDNIVNQKVLAQQLRRADCHVYVANHGLEALSFLRQTEYWNPQTRHQNPDPLTTPLTSSSQLPSADPSKPPTPSASPIPNSQAPPSHPLDIPLPLSIILMDIEMPIMDGLTCSRSIRQLQDSGDIISHIPVMAVSANARIEQVALARTAGMDDAISKPFRIKELLPKIEGLVRRGSSGGNESVVRTVGEELKR